MLKQISLLTLSMCIITLTGCTQSSSTEPTTQQSNNTSFIANDAEPVLFNLGGVDLMNDVEFNPHSLDIASGKTVAVFLFGQPLPAHPGEPVRINPNLEFGGLKEPIKLVAAMDGVVGYIKDQPETNDYEVYLMNNEQSQWIVGYDHVTDLQVQKGQTVAVGDVLGKAAKENSGYYRYELQINREAGDDSTMVCPTDLLDTSVRTTIKTDIDTFVADWNTKYRAEFGNDAYTMQTGGCLKPMVTNAESQGL